MLHNVNLLPWREAERDEHKRRFVGLLALAAIVALGIQWGIGFYIDDQGHEQQLRLNTLNQHISQLDERIAALKVTEDEHKALLTRLKVVESLQQRRNKTTELMNLFPRLIPEGVYVDKIKMNDYDIEVTGISDTTARLATMLEQLESSEQLSNVEMHSIVAGNQRFNKQFQSFKVSFKFHPTEPISVVIPVGGEG